MVAAPDGFVLEAPHHVRARGGDYDVLLVFCPDSGELSRRWPVAADRTAERGALWIAWPKRASGVPTDLTEDVVRAHALPLGWVDVKVCAVDEPGPGSSWSAGCARASQHNDRSTSHSDGGDSTGPPHGPWAAHTGGQRALSRPRCRQPEVCAAPLSPGANRAARPGAVPAAAAPASRPAARRTTARAAAPTPTVDVPQPRPLPADQRQRQQQRSTAQRRSGDQQQHRGCEQHQVVVPGDRRGHRAAAAHAHSPVSGRRRRHPPGTRQRVNASTAAASR